MADRATLTNGELYGLKGALAELARLDVQAKDGIKIARLIRQLNREIATISDVRNALIAKYALGVQNENGQPMVKRDSPEWPLFAKEHDAMMAETVEVTFDKVALPESVVVSVGTMVVLEPFLSIAEAPGASQNGTGKGAEVPAATK